MCKLELLQPRGSVNARWSIVSKSTATFGCQSSIPDVYLVQFDFLGEGVDRVSELVIRFEWFKVPLRHLAYLVSDSVSGSRQGVPAAYRGSDELGRSCLTETNTVRHEFDSPRYSLARTSPHLSPCRFTAHQHPQTRRNRPTKWSLRIASRFLRPRPHFSFLQTVHRVIYTRTPTTILIFPATRETLSV